MTDDADDSRANFAWFSNEYAQALQALSAIETQASTLLLMGYSDDLVRFIDQFIEMASNAQRMAVEKNEPNFAEWFTELVRKAQELRRAGVRE